MITSIGQSIDALKEEYGLDRELVIDAMKEAVKAAARKQFKSEYKGGEGIQVEWNDADGTLDISAQKTVVEEVESPTTEVSFTEAYELTEDDDLEIGDMLSFPLPQEDLGRIAAQTAKQILMQKIRDAVRKKVYEEFVDRKGELVNGLVKRFERGDMIVDLGVNLEAVLPRKEQARGETWNINERLRVVIADVVEENRSQQVVVSRASAELLKRLFEMEVPEIYDGTVTIKSAVREPGDRAKIAVASNEKDVDPVGACVGMKGARVQSVIKELRGEKIDIIEWSDEPSVFAANALSPAKVSQVRITDIDNRKMEVIVSEDQLSLAIGKYGQNVRLATRLIGWDIDIIGEDQIKKEIAAKMGQMVRAGEAVSVASLSTITPASADRLSEAGVTDIETLANLSLDNVVETLDVSLDEAKAILESAQEVMNLRNTSDEEVETEEVAEADEFAVDSAAEVEEVSEVETKEIDADEVEIEGNAEVEVSDEPVETGDDETDSETPEIEVETVTKEENEVGDASEAESEPETMDDSAIDVESTENSEETLTVAVDEKEDDEEAE
ncbi:MAG: transcription termination factor NusA [Pyrinomonadaceae bacterium]